MILLIVSGVGLGYIGLTYRRPCHNKQSIFLPSLLLSTCVADTLLADPKKKLKVKIL